MDTVVLFDPGIRSLNKGDEVIMASAYRELEQAGILKDAFILRAATHAPVVTWYQNGNKNPHTRIYDGAAYKFICGSNLMWKNMMLPLPSLNVNLWNCRPYRNSILMGVGVGQAKRKTNAYTKSLYKKILSKDYIHSARDGAAADFLESMGFKAIDTGCPTMWRFTPEFCAEIPKKKSENVIFTLTDYGKDKQQDQKLIDILNRNYKKVSFWIQGISDWKYFQEFSGTENITVIPPSLDAYSKALSQPDTEYVGTRLHAGMFAMQHKKRTIILAIDNRVRDMNDAYDLHVVERDNIEELEEMINSELKADVRLKQENINKWLAQFRK